MSQNDHSKNPVHSPSNSDNISQQNESNIINSTSNLNDASHEDKGNHNAPINSYDSSTNHNMDTSIHENDKSILTIQIGPSSTTTNEGEHRKNVDEKMETDGDDAKISNPNQVPKSPLPSDTKSHSVESSASSNIITKDINTTDIGNNQSVTEDHLSTTNQNNGTDAINNDLTKNLNNEDPDDIIPPSEDQINVVPSTNYSVPGEPIFIREPIPHTPPDLELLVPTDKSDNSKCQFQTDKSWLNLQYHDKAHHNIKKPDEIENEMNEPTADIDETILDQIKGSMIGMALGDALGAHVEFRPRQYLLQKPVTDLEEGGTWSLSKGQFTDDTSMALCLANSLVARCDFVPYDQLVRYKWWYKSGYMSSTGHCFDIGAATRQSVQEFIRRQREYAKKWGIPFEQMDSLSDSDLLKDFDVYCSEDEVAGNGALMRLAPVPLFFYRFPHIAVAYSGISGQITHGDKKAYDACRYYAALIVAAIHGKTKNELLQNNFYELHQNWFGPVELHEDILRIAHGSYKQKNGYDDGIRGKGYIVSALEAALWAFWSDEDSFEKGALAAVNLGDDTDTTAAIYGQLAGAYYGYDKLPERWVKQVYAKGFLEKLSKWIAYEGQCWKKPQ